MLKKVSVEVFYNELRKYKTLIIQEVIDNTQQFKDENNKGYRHEIILPIFCNQTNIPKTQFEPIFRIDKKNKIERVFFPGTEWLSLKLYIGTITADDFIGGEILMICKKLFENGKILKWFFVRYSDDDYHLRVRFLISEKSSISHILEELKIFLRTNVSSEAMHNVIVDSYRRELERYRHDCIEHCESIFSNDSFAVADFLTNDERKNKRWIFAIHGIDKYFSDFGFNLESKIEILSTMYGRFYNEFNGNRELKLQLDKSYREKRQEISESFKSNNLYLKDILSVRTNNNKSYIKSIQNNCNEEIENVSQIDILTSLIHMFINRVLISNHRRQEMVLYYILLKHYQSEFAQQKQMKISNQNK